MHFLLFRICALFVIFFVQNCSTIYNDIDFQYLNELLGRVSNAKKPPPKALPKIQKLSLSLPRVDTNLSETFFLSLEGYQTGAKAAKSTDYPWIARVVHSRSYYGPHICTAACVESRIFITAARCIFNLKVDYTTVIYKSARFPAHAFVLPANQSKQLFDDIGFIVVKSNDYQDTWAVVKLFNKINRTDDVFDWFEQLNIDPNKSLYKVVGYAADKGIHRIRAADRKFQLTELPVIIDINMCSTIFTFNHMITGFYVPCYHSCTHKEFDQKVDLCNKYHGVEGGAIINTKTKELLGVATWGAYFSKYELPVGFSVPNSRKFYKDYECARRIRNDNAILLVRGYYQALCETAYK